MIVPGLLDDLRTHPIRRPDKRVFLRGECTAQLARDTKVGELDCDTAVPVDSARGFSQAGKEAHHHRLHSGGCWQLSVGSQVRSNRVKPRDRESERGSMVGCGA